MKLDRYPNGHLELDDDALRVTGGDPVVIPRASIRSLVCRDGRPSWFSWNPPAVVEITWVSGLDEQRLKLLVPKETRAAAAAALAAWRS